MKPRELGGASLPNFQLYFWSAQIKHILSWFLNRSDSRWTGIDYFRCFPRLLCALPFVHNIQKIESLNNIFTVSNTLLVWKDVKKYLAIPNKLSFKSPIVLNPDLSPSVQNIGLLTWRVSGLSELGHLIMVK